LIGDERSIDSANLKSNQRSRSSALLSRVTRLDQRWPALRAAERRTVAFRLRRLAWCAIRIGMRDGGDHCALWVRVGYLSR